MKRRDFIKTGTAGTAMFSAFPVIRSKKSYRLVLIGSGWWGNNILTEAIASGQTSLVGICDVDQKALTATQEHVKSITNDRPSSFTDYRECLQQTKPEIVIVATPDHWHALCAIEAIQSGAHVYLEKPISHTIEEGKAILKAARSNDRIVQVGTHRRVSPHNVSGLTFLRSGMVGKVSAVKCFVNYGQGPGKVVPDAEVPEGLDWDMWLGPAPYRKYNPRIHPRGFRQFLDYANGTIGDWGIHWFDQVLWWSEETHPRKVFSSGGRFVKEDHSDAPDTQLAIFEFEEFVLHWEHKLCAPNANESANVGCYFYGSKGTFHMGWRDGWTFYPKAKGHAPIKQAASLNDPDGQNIKELWSNFLSCIESKTLPICDIETGYHASNMSLLAMISYRTGRSIEWNGSEVLADPEAAALMRRPYRAPWVYPEV
ncbi:MAG: Gfo/Idh/MocA family oxidoreductase [Saprospiraceae bacterium]|nr:Gfo/Idh/MocA family oxidoreductase [Saprospiraceae bacterium]